MNYRLPATFVPHFDFNGLLKEGFKTASPALDGVVPSPPIVFRHIDGRVGVPLFYMDGPDMGASLLRAPETSLDIGGDRFIFGWPGHIERYPLIPISSTTLAQSSEGHSPGPEHVLSISMRSLFMAIWREARYAYNNGELLLTYTVGDHSFETRSFHATDALGPVSCSRVTWHRLHLHSLVQVGPHLWQALFLLRNPFE
ncbi:hypothetical protein SISNIDRAFT_471075 [Sistotremastrum niveocremeum HHB9708]|uniref:Uncharacterized protein n=1 Tax=Sistotremastrum niveocremeum HHB9708 TaxID=1314777 RepID=A0A164N3Q5_9AGAM|nr:hypothetical protein SISNIDRAFT_471075 [Sistotremastrum niveocremeum HHB9708]